MKVWRIERILWQNEEKCQFNAQLLNANMIAIKVIPNKDTKAEVVLYYDFDF